MQAPWTTQADPTTRPKRPKGLKDLTDQTLKIFSDFWDPPDPIFGQFLVGFRDEKHRPKRTEREDKFGTKFTEFRDVGDTKN